MELRRLTVDDLPAARVMAAEAFGDWPPGVTPPSLPTELPAGRFEWGWFEDGLMIGRIAGLAHHLWLGGHRVASCGIAGVTVAPEQRGRGMLTQLFDVVIAEAIGRGDVVSTLYPTAPGIYRPLGWELIGSLDTVSIPTAALTSVRAPVGVTTRRATASDVPALTAVHDAWAAAQNGPLTRTGPHFTASPLDEISAAGAVSLAIDEAGAVVGYLSWERGTGYGAAAALTVHDLLASSADGYRALWRLAASFASVTGTVRLRTSGDDPAQLVLPAMSWDVVARHPYMFRVLDLRDTVAAMAPTLPAGARTEVDLVVVDDRLGLVDGGFRLTLGPDGASCESAPVVPHAATLTIQGLGLMVAGAQSCANLRLLGHLRDGSPADDLVLDSAFGGRQVHVRNYF